MNTDANKMDDDIDDFITLFVNSREEANNSPRSESSRGDSRNDEEEELKSVLVPFVDIRPSGAQKHFVFASTLPFFLNSLNQQDFRLYIPKLFANVLNSGDFAMINNFFRLICVPSCGYLDSIPNLPHSGGQTPASSRPAIFDLDSMIRLIQTNLAIFPDLVVHLHRAEFSRSQLNRGTKIILYFTMVGTKTFTHLLEAKYQHTVRATNSIEQVMDPPLEKIQQNLIRNHFDINPRHTILDPKPYKLILSLQISILLNEQNYVTLIEFKITPGTEIFRNPVQQFTQ